VRIAWPRTNTKSQQHLLPVSPVITTVICANDTRLQGLGEEVGPKQRYMVAGYASPPQANEYDLEGSELFPRRVKSYESRIRGIPCSRTSST
jgi:hypothetical protein